MIRVYNYMAMGVALTGVVSWLDLQSPAVTEQPAESSALTPFGQMIYSGPATIVLFLGTLGLVFSHQLDASTGCSPRPRSALFWSMPACSA